MATWIFQGNPKTFDVDTYLANGGTIRWLVLPLKRASNMRPGDTAFILRSDGASPGTGGIVAIGEIVDFPKLLEDEVPNLWRKPMAMGPKPRVPIKLSDTRLSRVSGMLLRTDLEEHPILKDLPILKYRSQIFCLLNSTHSTELHSLWHKS